MSTQPTRRSETAADDASIDRLVLSLCRLRVRVGSADATFLNGLRQCFDVHADEDGGPADLSVDVAASDDPEHGCCAFRTTPDEALSSLGFRSPSTPATLASGLNQWAVSHSSACYAFHAGAVSREGRGVLLPGASGHGKSTLTAALVSAGCSLLSDEIGLIDVSTGRIVGYPRAPSLRARSLELLGLPADAGYGDSGTDSRFVHPGRLGGVREERSVPPTLVVMPDYRRGAAPSLERLGTGAAVVSLMESSCSQPVFKVSGLDRVIALARRVPCYRLTYSETEQAVQRVLETLDAVSPGSL